MINKNIRVDLHIHSKASEYKEDEDIVRDSSVENLDVLFERLCKKDINLFSITDHNRFDVGLYRRINERLSSGPIGSVQAALPGVEFDVEFEKGLPHCHVIAIFDAHPWSAEDNSLWEQDYNAIAQAIDADKLTSKNDKYTLERFESILKHIGMNVLLIAHQHQSLNNNNVKKRSLSCASTDAVDFVRYGYIDALEYTKSRIQGILLSDFTELNATAATIVGSDCHTWSEYPLHNKNATPRDSFCSTIRALPSFKGLAMALSSPSTRFQQSERQNKDTFLEWVEINGVKVNLCPGLNAIIGENGVGKSSLLSILTKKRLDSHVSSLKKKNEIKASKLLDNSDVVFTIKQNELQERFWKEKSGNGLFEDSLYPQVDNSIFEQEMRSWSAAVVRKIKSNISSKAIRNDLDAQSLLLRPGLEADTYHIHAEVPNGFLDPTNRHKAHLQTIESALALINGELSSSYYEGDRELKAGLENAATSLKAVKRVISMRSNERDSEIMVRNAIFGAIEEYEADISAKVSDKDREKINYRAKKAAVIDAVGAMIADINKAVEAIPAINLPPNSGVAVTPNRGFKFASATQYSDEKDFSTSFLERSMNAGFTTLEQVLSVDTTDAIEKAVKSYKEGDWTTRWDLCLDSFIRDMCKVQRYIQGSGTKRIAGTLGEQSLTFYEYCSYGDKKIDVFIIDQPEDHISNSRIADKLVEFFNRMRSNRQVIFVTHSPLLVVNQDVDNVICLDSNSEGKITVINGCLESNGVLGAIAEKMEGGTEAVKRRLKAYGEAV